MFESIKQNPSLWLWATIWGVVITTLGTIIAGIIVEFVKGFQPLWLESIRERRALRTLFAKYRDPIVLSGIELALRLWRILAENRWVEWFADDYSLKDPPRMENCKHDDAHYFRYHQLSTIYRFGTFFAWIEIYRQEGVFLNPDRQNATRLVRVWIDAVREEFANTRRNQAEDAELWKDVVFFREELRMLGEAFIDSTAPAKNVISYTKFFHSYRDTNSPQHYWGSEILKIFLAPQPSKDFRPQRLSSFMKALIDLLCFLDKKQIPDHLINWRRSNP